MCHSVARSYAACTGADERRLAEQRAHKLQARGRNTEVTKPDGSIDALHDLRDLIEWFPQARLIDRDQAHPAMKSWGRSEAAPRDFRNAVAFHKQLRFMAERLADRRPVPID